MWLIKFITLIVAQAIFATSVLSYEVIGSIRQLENMQIFYPCVGRDLHYYRAGFPHFLEVQPLAKDDISHYLRKYEHKLLRVDADIISLSKNGMEGVVILKKVLEMGKDIRCEPQNQ